MKKWRLRLLGAALLLSMPIAAHAGALLDGVYYGLGNNGQNHDWTTITSNGIEVGQAGISRFVGVGTQNLPNVYNFPTGPTTVPTKTGANWGFAFSVDLTQSAFTLANTFSILSMFDVGTGGGNVLFDLNTIPDNGHIISTGPLVTKNDCTVVGAPVCSPTDKGLQNSEALSFPLVAGALGDPGFNVNANDTYFFDLAVYDRGSCTGAFSLACAGRVLAGNEIRINVGDGATRLPEMPTLPLMAAGLLGLGFMFHRQQKVKAIAA